MTSRLNGILLPALLPWVAAILLFGCGRPPSPPSEGEAPSISGKVPVEAYLFDVVIRRNGKPTSLRLDVFDADSVISLGGRAYLGKGALRGRLTADSLIAYFPTADEYLIRALSSFSVTGGRPTDLSHVGLTSILRHPPDTGTIGDSIMVDTLEGTKGEVVRIIRSVDYVPTATGWGLTVHYRKADDTDWRLSRFEYMDGNLTVTASRREYRPHARVPAVRFRVVIPTTAAPITL